MLTIRYTQKITSNLELKFEIRRAIDDLESVKSNSLALKTTMMTNYVRHSDMGIFRLDIKP